MWKEAKENLHTQLSAGGVHNHLLSPPPGTAGRFSLNHAYYYCEKTSAHLPIDFVMKTFISYATLQGVCHQAILEPLQQIHPIRQHLFRSAETDYRKSLIILNNICMFYFLMTPPRTLTNTLLTLCI